MLQIKRKRSSLIVCIWVYFVLCDIVFPLTTAVVCNAALLKVFN